MAGEGRHSSSEAYFHSPEQRELGSLRLDLIHLRDSLIKAKLAVQRGDLAPKAQEQVEAYLDQFDTELGPTKLNLQPLDAAIELTTQAHPDRSEISRIHRALHEFNTRHSEDLKAVDRLLNGESTVDHFEGATRTQQVKAVQEMVVRLVREALRLKEMIGQSIDQERYRQLTDDELLRRLEAETLDIDAIYREAGAEYIAAQETETLRLRNAELQGNFGRNSRLTEAQRRSTGFWLTANMSAILSTVAIRYPLLDQTPGVITSTDRALAAGAGALASGTAATSLAFLRGALSPVSRGEMLADEVEVAYRNREKATEKVTGRVESFYRRAIEAQFAATPNELFELLENRLGRVSSEELGAHYQERLREIAQETEWLARHIISESRRQDLFSDELVGFYQHELANSPLGTWLLTEIEQRRRNAGRTSEHILAIYRKVLSKNKELKSIIDEAEVDSRTPEEQLVAYARLLRTRSNAARQINERITNRFSGQAPTAEEVKEAYSSELQLLPGGSAIVERIEKAITEQSEASEAKLEAYRRELSDLEAQLRRFSRQLKEGAITPADIPYLIDSQYQRPVEQVIREGQEAAKTHPDRTRKFYQNRLQATLENFSRLEDDLGEALKQREPADMTDATRICRRAIERHFGTALHIEISQKEFGALENPKQLIALYISKIEDRDNDLRQALNEAERAVGRGLMSSDQAVKQYRNALRKANLEAMVQEITEEINQAPLDRETEREVQSVALESLADRLSNLIAQAERRSQGWLSNLINQAEERSGGWLGRSNRALSYYQDKLRTEWGLNGLVDKIEGQQWQQQLTGEQMQQIYRESITAYSAPYRTALENVERLREKKNLTARQLIETIYDDALKTAPRKLEAAAVNALTEHELAYRQNVMSPELAHESYDTLLEEFQQLLEDGKLYDEVPRALNLIERLQALRAKVEYDAVMERLRPEPGESNAHFHARALEQLLREHSGASSLQKSRELQELAERRLRKFGRKLKTAVKAGTKEVGKSWLSIVEWSAIGGGVAFALPNIPVSPVWMCGLSAQARLANEQPEALAWIRRWIKERRNQEKARGKEKEKVLNFGPLYSYLGDLPEAAFLLAPERKIVDSMPGEIKKKLEDAKKISGRDLEVLQDNIAALQENLKKYHSYLFVSHLNPQGVDDKQLHVYRLEFQRNTLRRNTKAPYDSQNNQAFDREDTGVRDPRAVEKGVFTVSELDLESLIRPYNYDQWTKRQKAEFNLYWDIPEKPWQTASEKGPDATGLKKPTGIQQVNYPVVFNEEAAGRLGQTFIRPDQALYLFDEANQDVPLKRVIEELKKHANDDEPPSIKAIIASLKS